MNKPVAGAEFRKYGLLGEELKVTSTSTPGMTVRVNPGIFYDNSGNLIEFEGGTSSTILPPASGYKWVIISLSLQGTILISSGEIKNKAPELPKIEKNQLPLAAIYVGANMTAIYESDICDIRPLFKSGSFPGDHTLLENRNLPDAHTIAAITGLQDALDKRVTIDAFTQYDEKVTNLSGTNSPVFTLNQIQSGAPTANAAIVVKRGTEPDAVIRFNEKKEKWEFTNNGIDWNIIPNFVDIDGSLRPASATNDGVVQLSVDPINAPIAVGDNDPRLARIAEKADKVDVYVKSEIDDKLATKIEKNDTYSREAIDNMLDGKLDVGNAYTDAQIDSFLRGKLNVGDAYLKAESDNLLIEKADKVDTYTKSETDALLGEKANASDVYAKTDTYTKDEVDAKLAQANERITVNAEQIALKATAENVYTKEESDSTIDAINTSIAGLTTDLTNYIAINDIAVNGKIDADKVYDKEAINAILGLDKNADATTEPAKYALTEDVENALNTKASVEQYEQVEDKVEGLSDSVRDVLVNVIPTIVTQTEYQAKNNEVAANINAINATVAANQTDVNAYKAVNDAAVASKVAISDFNSYQNEVSQKFDTKLDNIDFNQFKDANDDVLTTKVANSDFDSYKNEVTQTFDTKLDITDFNQFKADNDDVIDTKVAQTDYDAYKNEVSQKFDTKLDIIDFNNFKSDNDDALATKANEANVNTALDTKVNNDDFESYKNEASQKFDTKLDIIDFNNFKSDNDNALAAKVETSDFEDYKTAIDAVVASKADTSALDAYKTDNDAAVASKLNTTIFDTYKTDNDSVVATKANSDDVYTKSETYTRDEIQALIDNAVADALNAIREEINNG